MMGGKQDVTMSLLVSHSPFSAHQRRSRNQDKRVFSVLVNQRDRFLQLPASGLYKNIINPFVLFETVSLMQRL